MKIILKEDLSNLGHAGDIKTVSDGYGRNYLLPRGLAELATPGAIKSWQTSAEKRAKRVAAEKEAVKAVAGAVEGKTLTFTRAVSEDGTMFGSVAKSDIVKKLAESDIKIDKDVIKLDASIKTIGSTDVSLSFKHDVTAKIKVVVNSQAAAEQTK